MKNNEEFTEDAIDEIITRLPVKSLQQYRCVCKISYALINIPSLISRHINNYSDDNTRLVFYYVNASTYVLFQDQTLINLSSYKVLEPL